MINVVIVTMIKIIIAAVSRKRRSLKNMKLRGNELRRAVGAALLILLTATSWTARAKDRGEDNAHDSNRSKPPMANMSPEERREVREMRREKMRERFDAADQDRDRALNRDEAGRVTPRLQENFDSVDANKDGKTTPDEIREFRRERAKMRRIERGGADPRY